MGGKRGDAAADADLDAVSEGLVSVREAAGFLGLGKSTVYELMDRGQLPFVRLGRARRVPRKALREFAARNVVQYDRR